MRPRRSLEPPARPVPQTRINDAIRAPRVRLVDENGGQVGIKPSPEALAARIPYRVDVDASDDTVGKRIRNAEVEKIPYVIVYGDRESERSLAVRERGGEQSTKSLDELLAELGRL